MWSVGVIVLALCTAVGLVSATSARADATAPWASGALTSTTGVLANSGASTPAELGGEVVSMRTRFSRTYRQADGSLITRVSPEPVNFSTDGGQSWQAIDNRVVSLSEPTYAAKNGASDYDARLPRSLADPVKFAVGSRWVSFALGTDSPAPTLSGDTATYSVSPDLTASYSLRGAGVREVLSLAAASAPAVFRYHVDASAGLSPRLSAGGVLFVDESGRVRFGFSPPTVFDANGAAGHAALSLDQAGTGWTLTLTVDAGWLHDAARAFPVVVDPDVYWVSGSLRFSGATVDCHLDQAAASTSFCGTPWLYAGGSNGDRDTLLARFDLQDAIPRSAQVYGATFGLRLTDRTGATDSSMLEAHRVTVRWTEGATWSTSDGAQAWPAGFLDPAPAGPGITLGDPGWYGWDVTRLAQQWVSGETPNEGLALQDPTGSPQTRYEFVSTDGDPAQAPYLDIAWIPAVGQIGHYTLLDLARTATNRVRVNPGNGNVIVDATDAPLAGFAEGLARTYNSLGGWFQWSSLGPGWIPHYGRGIAFSEFPGGVVTDFPDGAALPFFRNPDGSYSSDEPNYATLDANGDDNFTVHMADGSPGTSITAYNLGWQAQRITRGDASIDISPEDSEGVRTFTDGDGTVLTQHQDGSGRIASFSNAATGRTVTYDYGADGMLDLVHTPERDTTYTYDGFRGAITSIAESTGTTISLGYDDQGRVTSVTVDTAGAAPSETTLAYEGPSAPCDPARHIGKTIVSDDYGTDVYCYDANLRVNAPRMGSQPNMDFADLDIGAPSPVAGDSDVAVNPANGNLLVTSADLGDEGSGLDGGPLELRRSYNSLSSTTGQAGLGATLNVGRDVHLKPMLDGSVVFHPGDGSSVRFDDQGDGTWSATPQLNADLTRASDGTYTLTMEASGDKYTFDAGGRLVDKSDSTGAHVTYGYTADERLASITDSGGNSYAVGTTADGYITSITNPDTTNTWGYQYGGYQGDQLIASITPDGLTASYGYDAAHRLARIAFDDGSTTTIDYDADGRAEQVSRTDGAGVTTVFSLAYDQLIPDRCLTDNGQLEADTVGATVVTYPSGKQVTYCFAADDSIVQTVDASGNPVTCDGGDNSDGSFDAPDDLACAGDQPGVDEVAADLADGTGGASALSAAPADYGPVDCRIKLNPIQPTKLIRGEKQYIEGKGVSECFGDPRLTTRHMKMCVQRFYNFTSHIGEGYYNTGMCDDRWAGGFGKVYLHARARCFDTANWRIYFYIRIFRFGEKATKRGWSIPVDFSCPPHPTS